MIKLEQLTKYYNKKSRGIIDVSLEVHPGEIFGFIGPNGAGKSTTVRTLLNLIYPTSGSAQVDGLDIVKDTIAIRKQVGYIPSEVNFYGDMTVKKFIKYASSFNGEVDEGYMDHLVEMLSLDVDRKIEDLSFGNKKKVAIVTALVTKPKILILDEPTSGLDPLIQNKFFQILDAEKKKGTTIFFSSHNLSEVERICDRVGIIREGKLVRVETIEDILKSKSKRVKIKTKDTLKITEQMIQVEHQNGNISFIFNGSIDELLKQLSAINIEDLSITEPTLEEIFMHFYEKEDIS
ncbi:ATP-binding cassette domain-containing protein [Acholeplasma laidlawii]|nr:ABC transporter ATP-binding protein [Acholeplasma laidlawii]RED20464.1 ABC-2 type transport system ATP-binding protein [Acholeplasma laidlawii]SQH56975.1 Uncharacterized ABC transporter ATP-binding protein YbhF [Acholeplasma laidlawii]